MGNLVDDVIALAFRRGHGAYGRPPCPPDCYKLAATLHSGLNRYSPRRLLPLYTDVVSNVDGVEKPEAISVSAADRDNCDAIDISLILNGAVGDISFPRPEEFTSDFSLSNIAIEFTKDGDNYKALGDATGEEVGYCTSSTTDIKFCM